MNIKEITDWFRAAVPEPTEDNRCAQIGCHFEEVSEMMEAAGDLWAALATTNLAELYKGATHKGIYPNCLHKIDRKALLDALCDQVVTAVGVAYMFGFDMDGALAEVARSNWSKYNEDGRPDFDANGKIMKGPSYSPPELEPFLSKPPMLRLPVKTNSPP